MDPSQSDPYSTILPFALGYSAITFAFNKIGGWSRLAPKYRCTAPFDGTWKKFQSGKIGPVEYGRCLWIGVTDDGLYLKTGPLFFYRLFHPPLFIPWSAIESVSTSKQLWFEFATLEVADTRFAKIRIPSKVIDDKSHLWTHRLKIKALQPIEL